MSRIRRLKKEKIKATISGLALMIAIGTAGGIGSYAYFTDLAEVKNDLVVTMGKLDVNFEDKSEDIVINNQNYDTSFTQNFKITNSGTLNQKVKFRFANLPNQEGEKDILEYFDYTLTMKHNNKNVILNDARVSGQLSELRGMDFENLIYSDGNKVLVELETYQSIECELNVKLNNVSEEALKEIQGKTIDFNTEVNSIQLGGTN